MAMKNKIKITFRLFASIRELVESNKYELYVEKGTSLREALIRFINETNPKILDLVIDRKTNQLRDSFAIFIDGKNIRFLNGLDTKIEKDTNIAIFPPVGGG